MSASSIPRLLRKTREDAYPREIKKKFLLFFINLSFVFADKPITAKDIINLEHISQPVINIGGTRIAYVKIVPPPKEVT